ncbi:transcriptional regulator, LytTR family [Oribacterium sp. KHPX15]|uniref:LytTR family DNA-binding domain-containing protein n=1 Tax=Oribacterium sp. KHPX15 TaxID=1855342 RepID=UPI00089A556F|nr:LytTR family DNA-binding domain-containing protein [Oribacterium sp. KHPX15]SDZ86613.1 transcriptional regulator, LytTR family [Oribacterium sp. KHPX15]
MSDLPDIKLIIDEAFEKLTVIIKNRENNEDVEGVINAIQSYANNQKPMIQAYFKGSVVMLPQRKIFRIYIVNRKILIQTSERLYEVRKNLRDLEELLDSESFIRISQSEILNIKRVKNFDFSSTGTIEVELENGEKTYVSRRRVKEIKAALSKAVI